MLFVENIACFVLFRLNCAVDTGREKKTGKNSINFIAITIGGDQPKKPRKISKSIKSECILRGTLYNTVKKFYRLSVFGQHKCVICICVGLGSGRFDSTTKIAAVNE